MATKLEEYQRQNPTVSVGYDESKHQLVGVHPNGNTFYIDKRVVSPEDAGVYSEKAMSHPYINYGDTSGLGGFLKEVAINTAALPVDAFIGTGEYLNKLIGKAVTAITGTTHPDHEPGAFTENIQTGIAKGIKAITGSEAPILKMNKADRRLAASVGQMSSNAYSIHSDMKLSFAGVKSLLGMVSTDDYMPTEEDKQTIQNFQDKSAALLARTLYDTFGDDIKDIQMDSNGRMLLITKQDKQIPINSNMMNDLSTGKYSIFGAIAGASAARYWSTHLVNSLLEASSASPAGGVKAIKLTAARIANKLSMPIGGILGASGGGALDLLDSAWKMKLSADEAASHIGAKMLEAGVIQGVFEGAFGIAKAGYSAVKTGKAFITRERSIATMANQAATSSDQILTDLLQKADTEGPNPAKLAALKLEELGNALDFADTYGIKLPATSVTDSKALAQMVAILRRNPIVADQMVGVVKAARTKLSEALDRAVYDLSPDNVFEKTMDVSDDAAIDSFKHNLQTRVYPTVGVPKDDLGALSALQILKDIKADKKAAVGRLYDEVSQQLSQLPLETAGIQEVKTATKELRQLAETHARGAYINNFANLLDAFVAKVGKPVGSEENANFKALLDSLRQTAPDVVDDYFSVLADKGASKVNLSHIDAIRKSLSDVNSRLMAADEATRDNAKLAAVVAIREKLSTVMDSVFDKHMSGPLAEVAKNVQGLKQIADITFQGYSDIFRDRSVAGVNRFIRSGAIPEKLFEKLQSANGPAIARRLAKAVEGTQYTNIKGDVLRRYLSDIIDKAHASDLSIGDYGALGTDKFTFIANKINFDVVNALMGPSNETTIKNLKSIAMLSRSLQNTEALLSGTGAPINQGEKPLVDRAVEVLKSYAYNYLSKRAIMSDVFQTSLQTKVKELQGKLELAAALQNNKIEAALQARKAITIEQKKNLAIMKADLTSGMFGLGSTLVSSPINEYNYGEQNDNIAQLMLMALSRQGAKQMLIHSINGAIRSGQIDKEVAKSWMANAKYNDQLNEYMKHSVYATVPVENLHSMVKNINVDTAISLSDRQTNTIKALQGSTEASMQIGQEPGLAGLINNLAANGARFDVHVVPDTVLKWFTGDATKGLVVSDGKNSFDTIIVGASSLNSPKEFYNNLIPHEVTHILSDIMSKSPELAGAMDGIAKEFISQLKAIKTIDPKLLEQLDKHPEEVLPMVWDMLDSFKGSEMAPKELVNLIAKTKSILGSFLANNVSTDIIKEIKSARLKSVLDNIPQDLSNVKRSVSDDYGAGIAAEKDAKSRAIALQDKIALAKLDESMNKPVNFAQIANSHSTPISDSKYMDDIVADYDARWLVDDHPTKPDVILEHPFARDEVEISSDISGQTLHMDASGLTQGSGRGGELYPIVYNYAKNRGLPLEADYYLSTPNKVKITLQQLSAAAKYRDTSMIIPSITQVGVDASSWIKRPISLSDQLHNLNILTDAVAKIGTTVAPSLKEIGYADIPKLFAANKEVFMQMGLGKRSLTIIKQIMDLKSGVIKSTGSRVFYSTMLALLSNLSDSTVDTSK